MTESVHLRIVVFGSSIVSDWNNPIATSARPILSKMVELGHDLLFLEQRNNPWLVGMLKSRGMAPARAFDAIYPEIQHRTYDLPHGFHRTVAFAQHVGTADAIIALPGTPDGVLEEIAAFRSRSVVRAVHQDAGSIESEVTLGTADRANGDATFGPAVSLRPTGAASRSSLAIVAYDQLAGARAAEIMVDQSPLLIDQSGDFGDSWRYVPEAELPKTYEDCRVVVVAGDWGEPLSWARLLLPMASGGRVIAVGPGVASLAIPGITTIEDESRLQDATVDRSHDHQAPPVPQEFDASHQAQHLLSVLRRVHDEKQRARR